MSAAKFSVRIDAATLERLERARRVRPSPRVPSLSAVVREALGKGLDIIDPTPAAAPASPVEGR